MHENKQFTHNGVVAFKYFISLFKVCSQLGFCEAQARVRQGQARDGP